MITAETRKDWGGQLVILTIDSEIAEYIAEVMQEEFERTVLSGVNRGQGDPGPREIADTLVKLLHANENGATDV